VPRHLAIFSIITLERRSPGADVEHFERGRAQAVATDDTITGGVAGRYASALFELAEEANQVRQVEKDLTALLGMLDRSPDMKRMVRSPVFSSGEQGRAIAAIAEKAGIAPLVVNFLKVLARNRRLFALNEMIRTFLALAARKRGEVNAEVASAHPLNGEQLAALKETLRASAGKDVQLITKVDPTLLGGIIVKMGSRMIDSSLRTKLTSLKTVMKEVR
jgi:F-type H+-transporting ATPase subunit delta